MSVIQAGNTTTTAYIVTGDTTGNLVFTSGSANTVTLTIPSSGGIKFTDNTTQTTAASSIAPTSTVYTSGSGTYTTPAGCKFIVVECQGAGGGGGGGTSGGTGGNTTFGSLTASGGSYGSSPNAGPTSSGGGASGGDVNTTGQAGAYGCYAITSNYQGGGLGGASYFGGGGLAGSPTGGGGAGYNGGGGGGAGGPANQSTGSSQGGGAGGYCRKTINSPASTYSYAVGAAGAAGGGTPTGGAGGPGLIIVTEYF